MKTVFAIAAAALVATPTLAAENFVGPRAEITAGADDVRNGADPTTITYGAAVGYDVRVLPRVTLGVDAVAANVFDRADLGVGVRAGFVANDNVLLFGRAGYTNLDRGRVSLEGLTVGGGVEVNVAGPFYGKVEYRFTDFDRGVGRHGGLVGVGVRF